jgi:hypothetical protein
VGIAHQSEKYIQTPLVGSAHPTVAMYPDPRYVKKVRADLDPKTYICNHLGPPMAIDAAKAEQ